MAETFTRDLMKTTQGRLADLGYYHGQIDGKEGVLTRQAMVDFKEIHELRSRPFPGPLTMTELWAPTATPRPKPAPAASNTEDPLWLVEARRLLGTREAPGSANNPIIMGWARNLDQWYPGDDVPWCGLFVAHCMSVGAPDEPQGFNRLGARAWKEFGVECPIWLGGVAVFWRTHPTKSWNGHVAIITGQSKDALRVIGGNQSDNVTETWIPKSRLIGVVGPTAWTGVPAPMATTGAFSTNEA